MTKKKLEVSSEYHVWLKELKNKISKVQFRAALAVNRELILFYWDLGESITKKFEEAS